MAIRVQFEKIESWQFFKELANIAVVENVFSSLQNMCYNLQGLQIHWVVIKKAVPNMIITTFHLCTYVTSVCATCTFQCKIQS